MTNLKDTPANKIKVERANKVLGQLLKASLKQGFYGTTTLELVISDGTIQTIRHKVEQVEKY